MEPVERPNRIAWEAASEKYVREHSHLPRIRPDRSYFGRGFVNDTFPANGAVEWQ